jgi:hypothetical protein
MTDLKRATRREAHERSQRAKARAKKVLPAPKREYVGRPFTIRYRVTPEEWKEARYMAAARGYGSLSAYLRALVENDAVALGTDLASQAPPG